MQTEPKTKDVDDYLHTIYLPVGTQEHNRQVFELLKEFEVV
jgi:hypothetical protein